MTVANLPTSYLHRGGAEPLLGTTLDAHFRAVARSHPTGNALVSRGQGIRLSYRALDEAVERIARGLAALGVQRGHRVGIWSTNNAEWVIVQMAAARLGAVLVNISPACHELELEHALRTARVQGLVLVPALRSTDAVSTLRGLCPEIDTLDPDDFRSPRLPDLRRLVVFDPADAMHTARPARALLTWPELLERGLDVTDEAMADRAASLDADDPINIQFTSGTTGFPKPVRLTHHNVLNNAWSAGALMGVGPDDRLVVPVPFYHCFGMVLSTLLCLVRGAALVIPGPHFDARVVLEALHEERGTIVHGVPTMFIDLLEQPDLDQFDRSALRTGIMGGAPCPPRLVRRVIDELGCRDIRIGYGQTESSPLTHLTRRDDSLERRTTTVGTNLPHQEVKIIDPATGAVVPIGTPGEICFRGYHVMRGYYEQPEATAEAIDEAGWLHSGDLGALDADGFLSITGRLKDLIIRGGENIYPAEIEAFYREHPKVSQVAVFGIPDERYGEVVGAWIKLEEGESADAQELRAAARDRLAHFKVPARIWIVDEFPMTVTGKIQKFRIREIVAAEQAREGAPA